MEKVIAKDALQNILIAVGSAVIEMDDEAKKAYAALWEILANTDKNWLCLANLAECEEYILWQGKDDVRFIVESGCCDELNNMIDEEQAHFFSAVANRINWSNVAEAGIEAGNRLIEIELENVLREKQEKQHRNSDAIASKCYTI